MSDEAFVIPDSVRQRAQVAGPPAEAAAPAADYVIPDTVRQRAAERAPKPKPAPEPSLVDRAMSLGRRLLVDAEDPARRPIGEQRGGKRAEVQPYVPADDGMRPGEAGQGRGFVNPGDEDIRPLTLEQAGRDWQGGVEQVKGLARGAALFGQAASWRYADQALADMDAIDATGAPRKRAPNAFGQSDIHPYAESYLAAPPEQRQQIRARVAEVTQRDQQFIADSVQAIKRYNEKQQSLSGKLPDFTDVRNANDFVIWAVRNGVATSPTMAASMLGALAGPVGLGATSVAMALGDMTSARAEHAASAYDPARFTNPDRRAEAEQRQPQDTARYLGDNVGTTAALAVPYAALDFLGPEGQLARGEIRGLAGGGLRRIATQGAQAVGGEVFNEGGQEIVNIGSDIAAGDRPSEVTGKDVKRVVNAGAVGGVMGGGGHVANVAGDAAREGISAAVNSPERQVAREIDRAAAYDKQTQAMRPTEQRKAALDRFDDLAATHGLPKKAATAAKTASEKVPLAEVPGFFKRLAQAYRDRNLWGAAPDDTALSALDEPRAPRGTDPVPAAEVLGTPENEQPASTAPESAVATTQGEPDGQEEEGRRRQEVLTPEPAPAVSAPAPVVIDELAHESAESPNNDRPVATPGQAQAGNYKMGHDAQTFPGLDLSIENPEGSTRRDKENDPPKWETPMRHHYGYLRGTTAADSTPGKKQGVDFFAKPGTPVGHAGPVFVVDQKKADGSFDEHKVMLGFGSEKEARAAYLANYPKGWKGLGAITPMSADDFKAWAYDPARTTKPAAADPRAVAEADMQAALGDLGEVMSGGAEPPATVFKTRKAASQARAELGNQFRLQKVKDGYRLRRASDAELAAAHKAGQRLKRAGTQIDTERDSLLAAIAKRGGLAMKERSDTIGEGNRNAGGRMVFTEDGRGIDMMAEALAEDGYIPPQELENDGGVSWLQAAIADEFAGRATHHSMSGEQWMRERADAAMGDAPDYQGAGISDADLARAGYDDATDDEQRALDAIEAAEIEAQSQRADDAMDAFWRSLAEVEQEEERDAVQAESQEPVAGDAQDGARPEPRAGPAAGQPQEGAVDAPSAASEGADSQGLTLEAHSAEDLKAKAEREQSAADAERKAKETEQRRLDKEAADREARIRAQQTVDDFQLGQSAEQQLSGQRDLLGGEPAPARESRGPRASQAWVNDGKSAEDLINEKADRLGADLAGILTEEASAKDFAPNDLPRVIEQWASDEKVPADQLRQATLAAIDKFDLSDGRKAQIRRALDPTRKPAPAAAPAPVTTKPTRNAELVALRKRESILKSLLECVKS